MATYAETAVMMLSYMAVMVGFMEHAAEQPTAPRLILCAGGMGSGKSRVMELLQAPGLSVIGFDQFATGRDTVDMTRHFHDEKLGINRDGFLSARQAVFDAHLAKGDTMLVETHLDNVEQILGFVQAARAQGYRVELHSVMMTPYTFMQLRKHKDAITDKTANGMESHARFMDFRKRLPFAVDEEQVYERIYNKHSNNVRPIGPERIQRLEQLWEVNDAPSLEPPMLEEYPTIIRAGAQHEGRVSAPEKPPTLPPH